MNDLEKYFRSNPGRIIHKCVHYFDLYEKYFARYRGQEVVILEIGVSHGGSLEMWKHYFGDKAKIYGVDIDPNCKAFEEDGIQVLIGSQSDRGFLRQLREKIPRVDILIDDGGHTMTQQIRTFEELFGHVKDDGIYLCEDLHTSYWLSHGGGHKRRGTFMEYAKDFADALNAHYSEQSSLRVTPFTDAVKGVYFHNGMVVIEKARGRDYECFRTGKPSEAIHRRENTERSLSGKFVWLFRTVANHALRLFNLRDPWN